MIFPTTVNGIPCQCKVTSYTPVIPGYTTGPPENCYPDEGGEVEFILLDRRGREASWLDRYVTPAVEERIAEEAHIMMEGEARGF